MQKFGEVQNKIPTVNRLATNTVLNTKIGMVKNKTPYASDLVQSFPYEYHNHYYKKLASRLWPTLLTYFYLIHTISSCARK